MIYGLLKFIVRIALRVFFKRFQVNNLHWLTTEPPVIITPNHPNTFMDPLIVATLVPQQVSFLANGSIFSRLTRPIFRYFKVVPIYRKQDKAQEALSQAELNKRTFSKCFEMLEKKGSLLIFPEGTSIIERRLRDIKTGTARIALGAEYENNFELGIKIIPVGLNYSEAERFRSEVYVNIGEPITLEAFKDSYNPEQFEVVEQLTQLIEQRLADTIVITNNDSEDELVKNIEILYKNQLFEDFRLPNQKREEFFLIKQIVQAVNYFQQEDPALVSHARQLTNNYLETLHKLKLTDEVFNKARHRSIFLRTLQTVLVLTLGAPLYVYGLIHNYLPYILPSKIANLITKDITFRAPIMMVSGIFTFLLFYGVYVGVFWHVTHQIGLTLAYLLSLPLSGYFVLAYWNFVIRASRSWNVLNLFYRNPVLVSTLVNQRTEIFKLLNQAKEKYVKQR
ncbi:MAG: 1-acyl-sn-glycerol-3-phosphate acyltransferase [Spirosomataceae bacterium]